MSEENIKNIEQKVDAQLSKANREKMTTLIGYTVIIIIIILYMLFLRSQTNNFTSDGVVDVAIQQAEDQFPAAKDAIRENLINSADQILNDQVDKLIDFVPEKRQDAEKFAKDTLKKNLIVADEAFSELFTNTLTAGRSELEPMLQQMENSSSTEEFEEAFYTALKAQLTDPALLADIADYGDILINVADRIEYLRLNEGLSETEQIERELLMALRSVAIRADKPENQISIDPTIN